MPTTAQLLADSFHYARQQTLTYYQKLEGKDIFKEFLNENGTRLNSAYWILGHLVVTENYLLLKSTGGEIERFAWARPFGLGGQLPAVEDRVPVGEIAKTMETVHSKAMEFISTLSDKQLMQPNFGGMKFGNGSIKDTILHAAFHEASHAGHLGWICKMHGIKLI